MVLTLIQSFQVLYFTEGWLEFIESRVYEEDERLSFGFDFVFENTGIIAII